MWYYVPMPKTSVLIKRDTTFVSLNMSSNALVKALREHGLTATKVIKPIVEALEAEKIVIRKREVERENGDVVEEEYVDSVPDHATRLKAAQIGIDLLGLKKTKETPGNNKPLDNKDMQKALKEADEVQLQSLVFKKN